MTNCHVRSPGLFCHGDTDNNDDNNNNNKPRSVNELLANLRLTQNGSTLNKPAVPTAVRRALNRGRRLPPGPPPPVSWLYQQTASSSAQSQTASSRAAVEYPGAKHFQQRPLPGGRMPARKSLIDLTLRQFAKTWDWQKQYCQYVLYQLPAHLRSAMLSHLTRERQGVTISDLKLLLLPPPPPPESSHQEGAEEEIMPVDNLDFHRLDLTNSPGKTIKLRDLSKFLYPPELSQTEHTSSSSSSFSFPSFIPESWDSPVEEAGVPPSLIPNLTHLSLAINPLVRSQQIPWPHLLSLARHLPPTLTHLSLAFWPEPSFSVSSSNNNNNNTNNVSLPTEYAPPSDGASWSESLMVLTRLSKLLYGLEYIDLTGCGSWMSVLWSTVGGDSVDWVDAWGQVEKVVLHPGYELFEDAQAEHVQKYWEIADGAKQLERHIRRVRKAAVVGRKGGIARGVVVESVGRD